MATLDQRSPPELKPEVPCTDPSSLRQRSGATRVGIDLATLDQSFPSDLVGADRDAFLYILRIFQNTSKLGKISVFRWVHVISFVPPWAPCNDAAASATVLPPSQAARRQAASRATMPVSLPASRPAAGPGPQFPSDLAGWISDLISDLPASQPASQPDAQVQLRRPGRAQTLPIAFSVGRRCAACCDSVLF